MTVQTSKEPLIFHRTGPMPCPYISGLVERNLFTELTGIKNQEQHDFLTKAGFRRSHNIVYRPACNGCNSCVPVRIATKSFKTDRSVRRILKRNNDIFINILTPNANVEHYNLFKNYQEDRHSDGEMAAMTFSDFRSMIEDTSVETYLIEFRNSQGVLLAGCLIDQISDAFSAVYSYFSPTENNRSLGNFIILWLVERTKALGLSYVYLGYWIRDCPKMSYKSRYNQIEYLGPSGWEKFQNNCLN